MTIKPWKILESTYLRKNVRVDRCELSNGLIIEPLILEYDPWVMIMAMTKQEEVLLIKQYRHGIKKVIWELPGGVVDPGEDPKVAARRELLEETGYAGPTLIEIGSISPNPASHTNMVYCYLVPDAEKVDVQHLDEAEEIEVYPTPLDQMIEMAKNGELSQALHVTTLFFALAHLGRIV